MSLVGNFGTVANGTRPISLTDNLLKPLTITITNNATQLPAAVQEDQAWVATSNAPRDLQLTYTPGNRSN